MDGPKMDSAVSARDLASVLVESLNLEGVDAQQIDLSAPLFGEGLGLDSLDMLELSLAIQQRYGVRLKADDSRNEAIFACLNSLAEHVGACQAVRG
jgi:acyl carrier protein